MTPKQREMMERIVRLDGRLQTLQVAGEAWLNDKLIAQGWVEIVDHPTVVDHKSTHPAEALKVTKAGIKALADAQTEK